MQTQVNEKEFGVELTKFYEEEEYHLPSIVYEFTSKRPYPVLVRVVETIPDEIDPQHIGFHKDSAMDEWKLQDGTLVFETEIAGRSEYKTVYAVYPDTDYDVEQLVTAPDKFTVEQASAVSRSHSDKDTFTRSSSSTQEEPTDRPDEPTPTVTLPDSDDEGAPDIAETLGDLAVADDDADDSSPPVDDEAANSSPSIDDEADDSTKSVDDEADDSMESVDDGAADSSRFAGASSPSADESGRETRADDEASLVDQLVAELREEDASEESLDYLEERFGSPGDHDMSVEVRIDQLQNDVADLRSYRNAFEDFLGQHGSPDAVVDRFEERLDSFDAELESVESRVEEQEGSVTSLRSEQEDIRDEIDTMTQVIWRTMQNLQELSTDVDRLDEEVADTDIEERMAEIEADIDEMAAVFDALQEAFQE